MFAFLFFSVCQLKTPCDALAPLYPRQCYDTRLQRSIQEIRVEEIVGVVQGDSSPINVIHRNGPKGVSAIRDDVAANGP